MDLQNDSMFTCISLYDFAFSGSEPCHPNIFFRCSGTRLIGVWSAFHYVISIRTYNYCNKLTVHDI